MSIRFVSQMVENDIYTVSSLGNTTSADWITCGACLPAQDFPNIGREFKCLSNSITGTGTVQDSQINLLSGTITIGGEVEVSNFPATQTVQPTYNHTTSVDAINSTGQTIALSVMGNQIFKSLTISCSDLGGICSDISFLKFYNLVTATETDTPILKVGILSNQSLVLSPDILMGALCVRATALFADADTTGPNGNICGSFFYTGYA
jgi:hypothetical protein